MGVSVKLQGPSQVDPSSNTGLHEKTGYLAKRPDGAIRIGRRQWPKRYCTVNLSGFTMSHSHVRRGDCRGHVRRGDWRGHVRRGDWRGHVRRGIVGGMLEEGIGGGMLEEGIGGGMLEEGLEGAC